jgi:hypothetical protein
MDSVTTFKVAFFQRCAEEGLTLDQINERVKTALAKAESQFGAEKSANKLTDMLGGAGLGWLVGEGSPTGAAIGAMAGGLKDYIVPAALGGSALLAGGGLLAGKSLAESQEDPLAAEEIKAQELAREYKRLADKTRSSARRRIMRENRM